MVDATLNKKSNDAMDKLKDLTPPPNEQNG